MNKALLAALAQHFVKGSAMKAKKSKKKMGKAKKPNYQADEEPAPYDQGEGNEDSVGGFGPSGYGV